MSYNHNANRIYKELPRKLVWESLPRVARKVLLLPGRNCLDILEGLLSGKADLDTEFHLFERDLEVADAIEAGCREMGLTRFQVFRGSIEDRPIGSKGLNRYDLIFLDFCGEMLEPVFNMLEQGFNENFSPKIFGIDGGIISCTFSTQGRQSGSFYNLFPGIRKGFKHPKGALQLCESKNNGYRARWSCDATLSALGLRSSSLISFVAYNDTGVPMVFFTIKSQKMNGGEEMAGTKGAGKKAWRTRRINALQRQYDATTSAGVKAGIKRKMNLIQAGQ